jgi:hypothetical protein
MGRLAQSEEGLDRIQPDMQVAAGLASIEARIFGEGEVEQALILVVDRMMAERFQLVDVDDIPGFHRGGSSLCQVIGCSLERWRAARQSASQSALS